MKRVLTAFAVLIFSASFAKAETIRILMETVPDTRYIQELLPEFEKETGITVEIEAISYIDMHSKLVPQLISPQGSYDLIVVDFYWVGEFTKAGWLMPLDELVARDGVDTDVYVPKLMDLVGRVDGTLFMLPFYNYSMAVIYRQDLLDDPAEQAAFKEKYGIDLKVPETWDEYWKQVQFFTRDEDDDGETRLLRHRDPGPARRLHLDAVGQLPVLPGRSLSRRELEPAARHPRGHQGDGVLSRGGRELQPGRLRGLLLRRGLQRDGTGQGV